MNMAFDYDVGNVMSSYEHVRVAKHAAANPGVCDSFCG